jgi:hypothetical protein
MWARLDYRLVGLMEGSVEVELASLEVVTGHLLGRSRLLSPGPNPAVEKIAIRYELAVDGHIDLALYDALGRWVCDLTRGRMPAGPGEVVWFGRNSAGARVAAGIYLIRFRHPDGAESGKFLYLRAP